MRPERERLDARIAKHKDKFNGGGHLARNLAIDTFLGPGNPLSPGLPAVFSHFDRRTSTAS
jgi:hypothetical protein